jgi:hypothetical protein
MTATLVLPNSPGPAATPATRGSSSSATGQGTTSLTGQADTRTSVNTVSTGETSARTAAILVTSMLPSPTAAISTFEGSGYKISSPVIGAVLALFVSGLIV